MQRLLTSLLFLMITWLASFNAQAAVTTLVAAKPVVWEDYLGVNAHFLWFTPEQYAKQIGMLKALGLKWVRVDMHWDRHEKKEGEYTLQPVDVLVNKIKEEKLSSLFYLVGSADFASSAPFYAMQKDQYPPKSPEVFAKRMGLLAQRYPSVEAWQIWNEPNLPSFWQPTEDPEGFSKLLLASVQELKRVAPQKTVVMGGMAYYGQMPKRGGLMLEAMGKLGALNIGAITDYHPYSLTPEGDDPAARDFIERVNQLNPRLRSIHVPGIWATEWGWSSYAGPKEEQPIIGEQGQADYTLRRLALMSAMDFDRIFLFALSDLDSRAGVRDRSYGLLDLNAQPKPVYKALSRFLALTGPKLQPTQTPAFKQPPEDFYNVTWAKPDGTKLWMFWSSKPGTVKVTGISSATLYQPLNDSKRTLQGDANGLSVPVTTQLQVLEWH